MEDNILTTAEVTRLLGLYGKCNTNEKLVLKQIRHITGRDIFRACSAYDSMPIGRTTMKDWAIKRTDLEIEVKQKKDDYCYYLNPSTGDISITFDGRLLKTGRNANVVHFYLQNNYAIPVYLGKGHWANRKSLFELGLATPDRNTLESILYEAYNQDTALIDEWYTDALFYETNLDDVFTYNTKIDELCGKHKIDINKILHELA